MRMTKKILGKSNWFKGRKRDQSPDQEQADGKKEVGAVKKRDKLGKKPQEKKKKMEEDGVRNVGNKTSIPRNVKRNHSIKNFLLLL